MHIYKLKVESIVSVVDTEDCIMNQRKAAATCDDHKSMVTQTTSSMMVWDAATCT